MSKLLFLLMVFILLNSCGVKKEASPAQPLQGNGNLPPKVTYSEGKNYLILPQDVKYNVGDVSVDYQITSLLLEPIQESTHTIEVAYGMPSMPEMKIKPATIQMISSGKVRVTYEISMGGEWEMKLTIKSKINNTTDTFTYRINGIEE